MRELGGGEGKGSGRSGRGMKGGVVSEVIDNKGKEKEKENKGGNFMGV